MCNYVLSYLGLYYYELIRQPYNNGELKLIKTINRSGELTVNISINIY